MSGELDQFFISIGVDSKDMQAGEKAVAAAVLSMQKSLEKLVGSFNDSTDKAVKSQKKLGDSTDKLSKDLAISGTKINGFFDSVKNNLLGLAGISLTVGGAFNWLHSTTQGIVNLSNQSKLLGISAKEIDGWQRAFKAAGSTKEAANSMLQGISKSKSNLQFGVADENYMAINRLLSMEGVSLDWQNSNSNQVIEAISKAFQRADPNARMFYGSQLGYDAGTINSLSDGSLLKNQSKFAANSGYTEEQERQAQLLNEKMEELNEKFKSLSLQLADVLLPYINELVQYIVNNFPEIKKEFTEFLNMMVSGAKKANDFAQELGGWKPIIEGIIALKFASWLIGILNAGKVVSGSLGGLAMLATRLAANPIVAGLLGLLMPGNAGQENTEDAEMAAKRNKYGANSGNQKPFPQSGPVHDYLGSMDPLFNSLEKQYGLPKGMLKKVAWIESSGNPNAHSPAGAEGLFQFMPATAKQYGLADRKDPKASALAAAKYLSVLYKKYGGDIDKTLAGYNAGPGNVDKYGGVPPFLETMNYVKKYHAQDGRQTINSGDTTNTEVHISNVTVNSSAANAESLIGDIQSKALQQVLNSNISSGMNY